MMTFGLGSFLIQMTAIKDIKYNLRQLNKKAKRKRYHLEADKRIIKFVEGSSRTK